MSLMERLLKTLRYNFLTEALDFVGVHQERTLQVRSCRAWGVGLTGVWAIQGLRLGNEGVSFPHFFKKKFLLTFIRKRKGEG